MKYFKGLFLIVTITGIFTFSQAQESMNKYVFIEVVCKPGFELLPGELHKKIFTNVYESEISSPELMFNAEERYKLEFKKYIKDHYPNSLNQMEDIRVYISNSKEEAELIRDKKIISSGENAYKIIELEM